MASLVKRNWKRPFLERLTVLGNATMAAKAVGVSHATVYRHRAKFPKFAAAWDDAVAQTTDMELGMAHRRAMLGSDALLMFLLKGRMPEVFGDKVKHEFSRLSDEELIRRTAAAFGRNGAAGARPAGPHE